MGSTLGPTFAKPSLCHYKKQELSNCPLDFQPQCFRQHVDDILVKFTLQMQ